MSKKELKKYTTRAMKLEESAVPQAVFVPPAIRGKMVKVAYEVDSKPVSIEQHVVRINNEADPVGMLIAIANGQPIPTFTVDDDGEIVTKFETLPLKDRITVMKFLSDKVLPRMSVFKATRQGESQQDDEAWGALLSNAGERADD